MKRWMVNLSLAELVFEGVRVQPGCTTLEVTAEYQNLDIRKSQFQFQREIYGIPSVFLRLIYRTFSSIVITRTTFKGTFNDISNHLYQI